MYASTLPRSNWLRRASIRLAWYRHMPASSYYYKCTKNCCKRTVPVQLIVEDVVTFLGRSVQRSSLQRQRSVQWPLHTFIDNKRPTGLWQVVIQSTFWQLRNGRFSPNLATKRNSVSRRWIPKDIFENFHFRGHLPENLKSQVSQTGTSLTAGYRSQDALQRDTVYSTL